MSTTSQVTDPPKSQDQQQQGLWNVVMKFARPGSFSTNWWKVVWALRSITFFSHPASPNLHNKGNSISTFLALVQSWCSFADGKRPAGVVITNAVPFTPFLLIETAFETPLEVLVTGFQSLQKNSRGIFLVVNDQILVPLVSFPAYEHFRMTAKWLIV